MSSSVAETPAQTAESNEGNENASQRISDEALRYFRERRHISEDVIESATTSQNNTDRQVGLN